tara:strand:+ start:7497 stop:8582 length:1086 start_codon:yes stop_codon:yes gene_type:complete
MVTRIILSGAIFFASLSVHSELIFEENFDAQPDWTTTGRKTVGTLPLNWDAARTDEAWHPSDGDIGTKPSMMINGDSSEQIYGSSGKAFITYSESNNPSDDNGFESDGILTKDIPSTSTLFIRFYVKFQPGWASNIEVGQLKMLRVGHWDGQLSGTGERYRFGNSGNNAPLYFYDWSQNSYGLRHFHAFRCDKQKGNYFCISPTITGAPRQIVSGDMSADYGKNIAQLGAKIPDLVNGGNLNYTDLNYHNQVFGNKWNKLEFYFELNSASGVQDGEFKHWINGQKIIDMNQIPWIGVEGDMNAKWNMFAIGGNDRFHFDLEGVPSQRERWYAIDNIEVYDDLPADMKALAGFPPNFAGKAK